MKKTLILFLLLNQLIIYGQTAGSGTLSTIESLANQEERNSEKMVELNNTHQKTYAAEQNKLNRLQYEFYQLQQKNLQQQMASAQKIEQKKYEIATSQSWQNRLKSAQNGYKEYNPGTCSAGGPPPICVADHWYRASVQEAMAEYNNQVQKALNNAAKDYYKNQNQLADKANELQNFQYGQNEFKKERNSLNTKMDDIQSRNEDIRERISQLSKKYVSLIEDESKRFQQFNIKDIMSNVAKKNFSELKTIVIDSKIEKLTEEEKTAKNKAKERIKLRNDKNIQEKTTYVERKKTNLIEFKNEFILKKKQINSKLSNLNDKKYHLGNEIKNSSQYTVKETDSLRGELKIIVDKIKIEKDEFITLEKYYDNKNRLVNSEIKKANDDIWNLKIELPELQNKYLEAIEEAFTNKRNIIKDALEGRKERTKLLENQIASGKEAFRKKVKSYWEKVDEERIRLMAACKKSGSTCWGSQLRTKVWGVTNGLLSCTSISKYHPVSYQTGECKIAYAHYERVYNSLVEGITDEDLSTFKQSRYSYKYSDILGNFKN